MVALLKVAFKNLSRHRVKTILTVLAITLGVSLFIFSDSLLFGMEQETLRNLVSYETGAAKIYSNEYFEKKDELPMYESFGDYEEIAARLDEAGYNSAPRSVFTGSLMSREQELPFMLIGVEPEREQKLFSYYKYLEPNYRLSKSDMESLVLAKISKTEQQVVKDAYRYSAEDSAYYLKEFDFNTDSKLPELERKLLEEETKLKEYEKARQDKNLSQSELARIERLEKKQAQKRDMARLLYNRRKRALDRTYLDDVKAAFKSAKYYKFLDEGSFEVYLGVKGATDLKVKVGDEVRCSVIIDIKDEMGRVSHVNQLINLKVGGIINSPNPKTNGYIGYLPLDILQDEMGLMLDGKITELVIRKKGAEYWQLPGEDESPEFIKAKLGSLLQERDDLTLVSWREDAKDYLAIAVSKQVGNKTLLGLLILLSIIGITNTMLMAVFERTKEIGMLRALGMSDMQVFRLFLYEAFLIGLLGTVIGLSIGALANIPMIKYGIDYTNIMAEANMDDFGYRVTGIFRGGWNIPTFIGWLIAGPLLATLAALGPALRATKLKIVDCLRFE